jgi:hypothetical protein
MAIKKNKFSIEDIKKKYSTKTKYKPEQFYNCGEAFMEACGLPGPVMGAINVNIGHSNSSKTTAMILAAVDAQRRGHLPIFIITEKKWSFDHAVELGLDATKNENGEWEGQFIFNDSFEYLEQITDFINDVLDGQEKGEIPYDLLFCIDSIGTIPCKMTYDGAGGTMHTAKALADKIGMGIHSRITKSKKDDYPYYNTMVIVNQAWVQLPDTPFGQPTIQPKGGQAIYLAASLVFLFGNQKNSGVNHIDATKNGRKVSFAVRTKISILKNHVSGLGYKDGKIIVVHNGYIPDTKEALDKYKKDYSEYWAEKMGGLNFDLVESEVIDIGVDFVN